MKTRGPLTLLATLALSVVEPAVCNAQTAVRTNFTVEPEPARTFVADFSTPWSVVETMILAAKAKDVDVLVDCFTDRVPEAFLPYREGSASRRELDTLADWAWEAEVIEVQMEGVRDAMVSVRWHPNQRPWVIQAVRTSGGWRIGGR